MIIFCVCRSEKLAELCYVSVLEDLGFVKAQEILVSESSQVLDLFTHLCHEDVSVLENL